MLHTQRQQFFHAERSKLQDKIFACRLFGADPKPLVGALEELERIIGGGSYSIVSSDKKDAHKPPAQRDQEFENFFRKIGFTIEEVKTPDG